MSWQLNTSLTLLLLCLIAAVGCTPTQPYYLRSDGDLSHYLDHATELEFPDTQYASLEEVNQARHPFTVSEFEEAEKWPLTLEECVSMALHNSKVIRRLDQTQAPGTPQQFIANPASLPTIYDPSIFETDPTAGVHAALAAFDTQLTSGIFGGQNAGADGLGGFSNIDLPLNNNAAAAAFFAPVFEQTTANYQTELAKRTASGATFRARHTIAYDRNNRPTNAVSSTWDTRVQFEATLPLLRGRGAQVNRIPVSIARINTDIALADFEAGARNTVSDVEAAYWNLYCSYRFLEVQKEARDAALQAAQVANAQAKTIAPQDRARASELYFRFRGDVERQLRTVYDAESNLRFLLGLAHTDGRLIVPQDEPTQARVDFNYTEVHTEALVRTAELRRQKWRVKQQELNLIAARNNLLPQLDAFAQYSFIGVGDELIRSRRNGIDFPGVGSTAFEELTDGDFQGLTTGIRLNMNIGFRQELAQVRNAQLNIAREKARLKDLELNVSHNLASSLRALDQTYQTMQSNLNRWRYTEDEVKPLLARYRKGAGLSQGGGATVSPLDRLLDAVQRRSLARQAFYQSLCDYNKGIADVHLRKGSLLEYNNIFLSEGPWPQKAYWDALGHARRRDASTPVDYGYTRPAVFSRGPVPQNTGELLDGPIIGDQLEGIPGEGAPTPIIDPAVGGFGGETIIEGDLNYSGGAPLPPPVVNGG